MFEVNSRKYSYDFSAITDELGKMNNVQICDLMPLYISYVKDQSTNISDYYWPIDGHHNSRGYTMMADGIYQCMENK
jgi:hypothetical protein